MIGPYPINISVLVPIGILFLILYSSYRVISTHQQPKQNTKLEDEKKKLLISLGSGGHTTEMLLMLQTLQVAEFSDRFYYISSGDSLSHQKLLQFESTTSSSPDSSKVENNQARVRVVARARNVMQSWWSTPFTASISLVDAVRLVYRDRPDLMICNGPGTCVMLVLAVLSLRYVRIKHCRIIFIESFARVNKLSLSGKILIHLVDRFLVMWPELAEKYDKAEYAGLLI